MTAANLTLARVNGVAIWGFWNALCTGRSNITTNPERCADPYTHVSVLVIGDIGYKNFKPAKSSLCLRQILMSPESAEVHFHENVRFM